MWQASPKNTETMSDNRVHDSMSISAAIGIAHMRDAMGHLGRTTPADATPNPHATRDTGHGVHNTGTVPSRARLVHTLSTVRSARGLRAA